MYEVNKYENFFSDKNTVSKSFIISIDQKKKRNEHLKAVKTYT